MNDIKQRNVNSFPESVKFSKQRPRVSLTVQVLFYKAQDTKSLNLFGGFTTPVWVQDKLWQPTTGEPLIILPTLPNGIPKLIRPYLAGKESTSLSDLRSKLKGSSHRMSEEQLQWWESFIRREEATRAEWDGLTGEETIALAEEKWTLQHLTKYNAKTVKDKPADPATERQERELERLLAKENSFPPVSTHSFYRVFSCHVC